MINHHNQLLMLLPATDRVGPDQIEEINKSYQTGACKEGTSIK